MVEAEVLVHYYSPRCTMIVEESTADCDGVRLMKREIKELLLNMSYRLVI